jgi:cytochrome d ubiquinol oxidase subunit I
MRPSLRLGLWTSLAACALTGDIDGKIMTEQQPMKMAAAEALHHNASASPWPARC